VTKVVPNSSAAAARLEPGKFITHVNNTPVQTPAEFYQAVKSQSGPVTLRLSEAKFMGNRPRQRARPEKVPDDEYLRVISP
jgi:S1-C subfamily serine protease